MLTIIDLDALTSDDKLPRVKLFGAEHFVRPLTGSQAHKLAQLQRDDNTNATFQVLLQTVGGCVPTLKPEQVESLSMAQLTKLIELARDGIAAVEASVAERSEKN